MVLPKKKGGWDCFRHYEIIAAGTLPYFFDLQNCPNMTLHSFPKELVLRGMALTGLPDAQTIRHAYDSNQIATLQIDPKLFNWTEYYSILQGVIRHSLKHCTYEGLGQYVLDELRPFLGGDSPRILYMSHDYVGYQTGVLYAGLFNLLQGNFSATFEKVGLHESWGGSVGALYGGGHSFAKTISPPGDVANRTLIQKRLVENFYNVVIFSAEGNGVCNPGIIPGQWVDFEKYQNRTKAIGVAVDGCDINGCKVSPFDPAPLKVHLHFLREAENLVWTVVH